MGQQSSKDSLLYKYADSGNIKKIKALHAQGADLEWTDEEGRTPLILACMHSKKYKVAKTLIELDANVNAYCPGSQGGTPLHHAAEKGLEKTVQLLLSNGANALLVNDNSQTPLHVARAKRRRKVVRTIESHICLFSGWLREPFGPVILGVLAPTLLSRKVWVVVLPFASHNLAQPFKLELAIYSGPKDSQPRTLVSLWNANMEGVKFVQSDHAVTISDTPNKRSIKLEPANETDKQQLHRFCNACKGIPQPPASSVPIRTQAPVVQATAPSSAEDLALARGIDVSIQLTMESRPARFDANYPISGNSASSRIGSGRTRNHNELQEFGSSGYPILSGQNHIETPSSPLPSAPPIENAVLDGGASSSCVICLDAPIEGACIPCGHMVGCMPCLNEIEGKNWGCPVCRTKINQVMRLYAV